VRLKDKASLALNELLKQALKDSRFRKQRMCAFDLLKGRWKPADKRMKNDNMPTYPAILRGEIKLLCHLLRFLLLSRALAVSAKCEASTGMLWCSCMGGGPMEVVAGAALTDTPIWRP
jgi:hypothetical protein